MDFIQQLIDKMSFSVPSSFNSRDYRGYGFTIVELLVVIVIVGILAAITLVSYTNITQKAIVASLQSDLTNASTQLKLDQVQSASGTYSSSLALVNNNKGVPSSPGTTYQYATSNVTSPSTFCLTATNGAYSYNIDADGTLLPGGKNLAKSSSVLMAGSGATGITSSLTAEGYLQVVSAAGNGNWFTGFVPDYTGIESSFNENDDVVVSMEMKSPNHNSVPDLYFKPGMGYFHLNGTMGSNFSTVWVTTKWKKANALMFHLGFSGVIGTTIVKNFKIAKGTVPTCWTPDS